MFERYTEKARRVIFFARYEASSFGTQYIDTDHLLLGLLREDKSLFREVLLNVDYESARNDMVKALGPNIKTIPTSVDLPLNEDAKHALKYAAEEADRLNTKPIDTEHLLLGLSRDPRFSSARFLARFGMDLESLRKKVQALPPRIEFTGDISRFRRAPLSSTVELHGKKVNTEPLRRPVARLREHHFLWERRPWQPRDVAYEKNGKRFSFDVTLAVDSEMFLLVKGGWEKDRCAICDWELFESDDAAHGAGFTNGREWICEECYAEFIANDFFASSYSDLT
jgi:hypothetical protein